MTIPRAARSAAALALVLGLAACAEHTGRVAEPPEAAPSSAAEPPAEPGALVLRVEYTGGFVPPSVLAGRLPIISVYADGRVLSEGPVAAIYPGPALPNVQVQQLDPAQVRDLADRAVAAGVTETGDLGSPPVADAPNTRFTLVTADGTTVREVYALWETPQGDVGGVTPDQAAARERLSDFLGTLTDATLADPQPVPYVPSSIAAVVSPWVDPDDGLTQAELRWPGPALPGEPAGPGVGCVTADAEQTRALLAAAESANAATPWVAPDGTRWSVVFRPLLPDETGCADLID
ncbi:MAG TPA: hypothetical protein VK402_11870 [Blastococcus sp.]|nr:hypothetical protein [Blastococcus sp.]